MEIVIVSKMKINNFKNILMVLILVLMGNYIYPVDYDSHPCYLNSSMVPMSLRDETNYFKPMKVPKNIYALSYYAKSSYLINQYTPSMQIIREIVNYDNYIKVHNNPRYYFIKSLEDLYENDIESSKSFLEKFLTFSPKYLKGSKEVRLDFFTQGCNTDDIDWILNYQNTKEYRIASLLKDYLNNKISDKELIKKTKNLDTDLSTFDIYDNLIFIIMKINNYSSEQFKILFNDVEKMQLNNLLYNNGLDYVLTSQMAALSMFKYFIADNYFSLIEQKEQGYLTEMEKIEYDVDEFNHSFLFPLIYYFESKINFFNDYDVELFQLIKFLISNLSDGDEDIMINYNTWLELFEDKKLSYYKKFKSTVNDYKNHLIEVSKNNNYINETLDINTNFSTNFNKQEILKDSVYFTKIYQELNERKFFYDISKPESFWIPEIDTTLKIALNTEISEKNSFYFQSYPMMRINDNEKIIDASLMFFYIYDFYNDVNLEENIISKLDCKENINEGIEMFFYSVQELKKIMHP